MCRYFTEMKLANLLSYLVIGFSFVSNGIKKKSLDAEWTFCRSSNTSIKAISYG